MKRNILAIAIPALLVAGIANAAEVYNKNGNKVDIYGRVKAANYINTSGHLGDGTKDAEGDHTEVRFGFLGETQITEDLVGYGRAEWQKNLNDGSTEIRYGYAGFRFADWGSLDYGKNDGLNKTVRNYTDVLPSFGGDSEDGGYGVILGGREKAVLTYRNNDFFGLVDGLKFAIQYKDSASRSNGVPSVSSIGDSEAFGVYLGYDNILDSAISASFAYSQTLKDYYGDRKARSYSAAIKYDENDLYLAALYHHTKYRHDSRFNGFEVVAQYGFDFDIGRLTPSVAYVQGKTKENDVETNKVKYVELGATYDFNKNMSALIDYKFDLVDDLRDQIALGVIYRF